eukprot:3134338-Rhodomonas_salina.2
MEGHHESFWGRSGAYEEDDVRFKPRSRSSVATAQMLIYQRSKPVPYRRSSLSRGKNAFDVQIRLTGVLSSDELVQMQPSSHSSQSAPNLLGAVEATH